MTTIRERFYQIHDLLTADERDNLERIIEYAGKHADENDITIAGDEATADAMNDEISLLAAILQPWNFNEDGSALPIGTKYTRIDPRTPRPWLIQLIEDNTHYWLDTQGWVLRGAQAYTDEEHDTFDLPMGGVWYLPELPEGAILSYAEFKALTDVLKS